MKEEAKTSITQHRLAADDGIRTRRAHAASSHNDTIGSSAPYLWLQSEMHLGPMHESNPGGVKKSPKCIFFLVSFLFFKLVKQIISPTHT